MNRRAGMPKKQDKLHEYIALELQHKADKRIFTERRLSMRKELHKEYYQEHKTLFRWMDVLFVLAILSNVGASLITEALVVKASPGLNFTEGNPIQADLHGWGYNANTKAKYAGFVIDVMSLAFLVCAYIYFRMHLFSDLTMIIAFLLVIFIFACLFQDFNHDLGLYLGKLIYGAI